jgi:hypothetical protein
VCVSVTKFFSAGAGGLVERGNEPDPDEVILNCYKLADRYKQNPTVFLNMPLSEVSLHLVYTIKLALARAKRDEEEEDD